mgnify:CR=1 FL=1
MSNNNNNGNDNKTKIYFIILKKCINYIDILIDNLPDYIIVKHNLLHIDKNSIIITADIDILNVAIKLNFKNIYFYNIE